MNSISKLVTWTHVGRSGGGLGEVSVEGEAGKRAAGSKAHAGENSWAEGP